MLFQEKYINTIQNCNIFWKNQKPFKVKIQFIHASELSGKTLPGLYSKHFRLQVGISKFECFPRAHIYFSLLHTRSILFPLGSIPKRKKGPDILKKVFLYYLLKAVLFILWGYKNRASQLASVRSQIPEGIDMGLTYWSQYWCLHYQRSMQMVECF